MGDQVVDAYSRMGRVMALYVQRIVSLDFPHFVDVSARSMFVVFLALFVEFWMCVEYVSLGSKVSPRIFGCGFVGSVVPCIVRPSCVLYSAGSGVKRVVVVLDLLRVRWLAAVQSCICWRYGCICCLAASIWWCVDRRVMSSA